MLLNCLKTYPYIHCYSSCFYLIMLVSGDSINSYEQYQKSCIQEKSSFSKRLCNSRTQMYTTTFISLAKPLRSFNFNNHHNYVSVLTQPALSTDFHQYFTVLKWVWVSLHVFHILKTRFFFVFFSPPLSLSLMRQKDLLLLLVFVSVGMLISAFMLICLSTTQKDMRRAIFPPFLSAYGGL